MPTKTIRHCERSDAIQPRRQWIASSLALLAMTTVVAGPAFAQDDPPPLEVDVVGGITAPMAIAVPAMPVAPGAGNSLGHQIAEVVASDLRSTGLFTPLGPRGIGGYSFAQASSPVYAEWRNAGASALVSGYVEPRADGRITVGCYLFDVAAGRELARQARIYGVGAFVRGAAPVGGGDGEALAGEQPFLDTRIVYVAETGPKTNRQKRIAIMDSDGSNHRYLTEGKATVLTPRFSPRGDKLVYMSYQGRRPRVYVMDVATGAERLLVPGTSSRSAPVATSIT